MTRKVAVLMICGILVYAAPSLCSYSIPTYALTEGGGSGADSHYEVLYTTGQASPIGVSTDGTYSLIGGLMPTLLLDAQPPLLQHQPIHLATDGMSVEIETSVTDARAGVDTVVLYYREGGHSGFTSAPMTQGSGDIYTGTIPASSVTEKGLTYYIEAADLVGNVSRYPSDAPDGLVSVRVMFTDLESALELPAGQYRMISLPGSTSGNPDTVLVDDFGAYDKTVWRLGRWNAPDTGCAGTCYDEYPSIAGFYPGRAYWLISSQAMTFDCSGMSVDICQPFAIRLEPGWNQIGTPFAFTTDWATAEIACQGLTFAVGQEVVIGQDTIYVEDNLISYDGTYHGLRTELVPWDGYWVYSASTVGVDLVLHPAIPASPLAESPDGDAQMEVLYGLKATARDLNEGMCLAGMSRQAKDGWDAMDRREPPPIGDYVRAVFDRPAWGRHSGTYMADVRVSSASGASWDFTVQVSRPADATLEIESIVAAPRDWRAVIYDTHAGMKLTPDDLPYRFRSDGGRDFILVVGTDAYIEAHEAQADLRLRAQIVSVSPNPFDEATEIRFFIPRRSNVRMQIFSVEGRLVRTVADSKLDAGLHTARWRGLSENRGPAAPGIYFLRLEVPGAIKTAKILRVR